MGTSSERATHEQARAEAVRRLQLFAEKRLLEEAGENLQPERTDLAPNPAVELARRIEQALESISSDEGDWIRAQSGIQHQFSDLNDQLGMRGYHPQAEMVDEGVFAVTCAFHGQAHTMTALHRSISDEMANREQMLDAREREIIENHLIGEIATELQTLIREGEDWVRVANGELDRQPASSGIKLRFVWEVNAEAADGLDAARQQLLKMTAAWSPAERDSIGRFLHGRIKSAQLANEAAAWPDHLRTALDYRGWHRFGIMRYQDGQWKKLTKQTYGTGSGGEKALLLTLPQFAAAAAHYQSAAPFAPRLILLDEVFIGIDAPTRARLMGLIESFDLDFMMTSEREWGCYPTVPALAICQLASRPDSPAVHVSRWVWNGRKLVSHSDGPTI
ncbi:MAG: SbcC/MukB-like Walker B domain-containing protein [Verrucomicrobiota bacterium]